MKLPILILLTTLPLMIAAQVPSPAVPTPADAFRLWSGPEPLPNAADIPILPGIEFQVIKRWEPDTDGYHWLHGVALAWHNGKLFASFGHNRGQENTPGETAHGRASLDGSRTWGELFPINPEPAEGADLAVSHGVFLSHQGVLWSLHGSFSGHMQRVHTQAFTLDDSTGRWQPRGVVIESGFWPLNQPVRMDDGNWIMPGISVRSLGSEANPPAVAISHAEDFTKWALVVIPVPSGVKIWGESGVIVDGKRVTSISRYGAKPLALAATSEDHGRTWTTAAETNLPMATSKPCTGILSNGQRYLIDTTTGDTGARRSPLTIAVSRPGETTFSKVWVIRRSLFPEGPGESFKNTGLSYPCATEHEGKLYVGYSNNGPARRGNQNGAELAIIPIEKLAVDP